MTGAAHVDAGCERPVAAGFAASSTSGFVASDRSDSGLRKADEVPCPARRKREIMGGDGEGRKASTLGRARKASNRITRDKRRRAFFSDYFFLTVKRRCKGVQMGRILLILPFIS